jgi:hypothetical protein
MTINDFKYRDIDPREAKYLTDRRVATKDCWQLL